MRPSLVALSFLAAVAAAPAFAADVPESYYEHQSYDRPPVDRQVIDEEPAWRRTIVEEEPVEERVIVRRSPPIFVRRTYVEDLPPPRPRYDERRFDHGYGWREGRFDHDHDRRWRGRW